MQSTQRQATEPAPTPAVRQRWRKRLLGYGGGFHALLTAFILLDARLPQRIVGPRYNGIPLVAWQEYFVEQTDKAPGKKSGWWRLAH
jgi:hypothetical protein